MSEWDLFTRIEEVEKLKPTTEDASKLAAIAFLMSFIYIAVERPSGARKFKDFMISWLKNAGLSTETINQLEKALLVICEESEKG